MSDAVTAVSRPVSFIPDTPVAASIAPKITLLPQNAAAEAGDVAQEGGFTQALEGYLKELAGPDHVIDAAADARADNAVTTKASQSPASVGDAVKLYLAGVNDQVVSSDAATRDVLTGKNKDVGAVTAQVEEADLSLDLTVALARRLTTTFTTIQQIQF